MTREEIAIRQEIRQMLNEAGFNQQALKGMIQEELHKLLEKRTNEFMDDLSRYSMRHIVENIVKGLVKEEVQNIIRDMLYDKHFNINIQ